MPFPQLDPDQGCDVALAGAGNTGAQIESRPPGFSTRRMGKAGVSSCFTAQGARRCRMKRLGTSSDTNITKNTVTGIPMRSGSMMRPRLPILCIVALR
jgi:hypothetical protein